MSIVAVTAGSAAEWSASNLVLEEGEMGYDYTNGRWRIGDGVTAWGSLPDLLRVSGTELVAAINGSTATIDDDNVADTISRDSDLSDHTGNTSNPHSVDASDISLGNVTNVAQLPLSYLETAITNSDVKVPSSGAVIDYYKSFMNWMDLRKDGNYHFPSVMVAGSGSDYTMSANYIYYYPLLIGNKSRTLNGFAINSSNSTSGTVRFGLYADNGNTPGSLIYDAGALTWSSGTGLKELACGTPQTLNPKTLYWIALVSNGNINCYGAAPGRAFYLKQSAYNAYPNVYREDYSYAALPSSANPNSSASYSHYPLIKF